METVYWLFVNDIRRYQELTVSKIVSNKANSLLLAPSLALADQNQKVL